MTAQTPRILVVDDNECNRYAMARVLRAECYEVLEGRTGAEALSITRGAQPDVVVLDVKLPDMLGWDVAGEIRRGTKTASIRILQVSATFTDADAQAHGLDQGADTYLLHPVEPQVLVATVRSLLRLRRAEQKLGELLVAEQAAREAAEDARRYAERSDRERARLVRELEEALRVRDEFLAIASHDLRGPLGTLQLSLETMLRTLACDAEVPLEKVTQSLSAAGSQVQSLVDLLEGLLDVSRLASGKLALKLVDTDLVAVLRRVMDQMEAQARAAGTELRLRAGEPVVGRWDPIRLEQLINNLLSNAVKFSSKRPVEIEVTSTPLSATFVVRDHGVGIAAADQARIFERFERVAAPGPARGFGLGLWIVQRVVDALGGNIRLHSEPGKGSAFQVELPREPAPRIAM